MRNLGLHLSPSNLPTVAREYICKKRCPSLFNPTLKAENFYDGCQYLRSWLVQKFLKTISKNYNNAVTPFRDFVHYVSTFSSTFRTGANYNG